MSDALDDPALDLALCAERVDHAADVVDCDDLVDPHLACLDVDGDLRDLDAERQDLHTGRVRPSRALTENLTALEQARNFGERPGTAVGGDDLSVPKIEHPFFEVEPLRCDLDDLAFGIRRRRAHCRPHRRHGRRACGDRRKGPAGRVAERNLHVVERNPELLRRDLGHRRARAGADVLHRSDNLDAAV